MLMGVRVGGRSALAPSASCPPTDRSGHAKRAWAALAGALFWGLGLGGCATRPPPGPTASAPSNFTPRPSLSLANAETVRARWWAAFASPELDGLEDAALSGNLDLEAAKARLDEARAQAKVVGAALYPNASLQAGASSRRADPFAGKAFAAAVAGYDLDFRGRNRALRDSALSAASAAGYDAEATAVSLTASVADAYFDVLAQRARLALARRIAADARQLLYLVSIQEQVGTGAHLQVELQTNQVAAFDQAAAAAEQLLEDDQHLLAILIGRPPEDFLAAPAGVSVPSTPVVSPETPVRLLQRRPDIAAAQARLLAAGYDVRAARAAFLPDLTLVAAAGLTGAPAKAFAGANGALLQPIFQGDALSGQLRYAKARRRELEAAYGATLLTALREVEDGLSAQTRLAQEDAAAQTAVASARRAAALGQAEYRLGASDYLTVLTAERAQYQAEDQQLQIHALRLQAAANLFRALGGGFQRSAN